MSRKYSKKRNLAKGRKVQKVKGRRVSLKKGKRVRLKKGKRVRSKKRTTRRSKKRMVGGMGIKLCMNRYLLTQDDSSDDFNGAKYDKILTENAIKLQFDDIKDLNWHSDTSPGSNMRKNVPGLYNVFCPPTNKGHKCSKYWKATKHSMGPFSAGDCYYMTLTTYIKSGIPEYKDGVAAQRAEAENSRTKEQLKEAQTARRLKRLKEIDRIRRKFNLK